MSGMDLEKLARTAYEAHRNALAGSGPLWDEAGDEEQRAWRIAVSAVAGPGDPTITEMPSGQALVVQAEDQTHIFRNEFIAGRQGSLVIDDEHASGQHALFQTAHRLWYVEDLGSTNGTWLNGRRIFSSQRLRKGDKIRIGRTVITVVSA
ncbi:MAG: FHA domain-containing protein [Streptosporangiaceae bacterium]|nr:FHA domain-containing protein [Streptosporangiaceae bacterium]